MWPLIRAHRYNEFRECNAYNSEDIPGLVCDYAPPEVALVLVLLVIFEGLLQLIVL